MDYESMRHRGPYTLTFTSDHPDAPEDVSQKFHDLGQALTMSASKECVEFVDGGMTQWFYGNQDDQDCDYSGLEELSRRHAEQEHDLAHFEAMAEEQEERFERVLGKEWLNEQRGSA